MSGCVICGKQHDLFRLQYSPEDTDANASFDVFVCGTHWEVIAKIAKLSLASTLQDLTKVLAEDITKLEQQVEDLDAKLSNVIDENNLKVDYESLR